MGYLKEVLIDSLLSGYVSGGNVFISGRGGISKTYTVELLGVWLRENSFRNS